MYKKKISAFAYISIGIFLICSAILALSRRSVAVADFVNGKISAPFRRVMAFLGDLAPFSIFQVLVILLPLIAVIIIIASVRVFSRGYGRVRFLLNIISVALLLYSGNAIALGVAYNTTGIDERMNLPDAQIDEDELREAMCELCSEINALSSQISYSDGESHAGCDIGELSERICRSYSNFSAEYGFPDSFVSHAKSARALHILSYLGLTGIYTYYTGESNVNTDYPDYVVAFTAAHELSHQRGILRENEANFMAYLICSRSDDAYLRYSAALSMLTYVGNALWSTDRDSYYEILEELDERALADIRACSRVNAEYGDTLFTDISDFVNDLFLKSNGTDGIVTYGRVVTLYMSYRQAMQ